MKGETIAIRDLIPDGTEFERQGLMLRVTVEGREGRQGSSVNPDPQVVRSSRAYLRFARTNMLIAVFPASWASDVQRAKAANVPVCWTPGLHRERLRMVSDERLSEMAEKEREAWQASRDSQTCATILRAAYKLWDAKTEGVDIESLAEALQAMGNRESFDAWRLPLTARRDAAAAEHERAVADASRLFQNFVPETPTE